MVHSNFNAICLPTMSLSLWLHRLIVQIFASSKVSVKDEHQQASGVHLQIYKGDSRTAPFLSHIGLKLGVPCLGFSCNQNNCDSLGTYDKHEDSMKKIGTAPYRSSNGVAWFLACANLSTSEGFHVTPMIQGSNGASTFQVRPNFTL